MICSVCSADENIDAEACVTERDMVFGPTYVACTNCEHEMIMLVMRSPQHANYCRACSKINMMDSLRSFSAPDYMRTVEERIQTHMSLLDFFEEAIAKLRSEKQKDKEEDDTDDYLPQRSYK